MQASTQATNTRAIKSSLFFNFRSWNLVNISTDSRERFIHRFYDYSLEVKLQQFGSKLAPGKARGLRSFGKFNICHISAKDDESNILRYKKTVNKQFTGT